MHEHAKKIIMWGVYLNVKRHLGIFIEINILND